MADIYSAKKIRWFEEYAYHLIKNINHTDFHKEREQRLAKYSAINSAVIKIFAYRLTYMNFETLRDQIARAASEIASEETMQIFKKLESEDEEIDKKTDGPGSRLIRIILLLLHEETDKYLAQDVALDLYLDELDEDESEGLEIEIHALDEDEKTTPTSDTGKKQKESGPGWTTSSSGDRLTFKGELMDDLAKHLAEYEQKKAVFSAAKLKTQEPDAPEDKDASEKEDDEDAVSLEDMESQVDRSLDNLIRNMGDDGLDELIFGRKSPEDMLEEDEDRWMDWID